MVSLELLKATKRPDRVAGEGLRDSRGATGRAQVEGLQQPRTLEEDLEGLVLDHCSLDRKTLREGLVKAFGSVDKYEKVVTPLVSNQLDADEQDPQGAPSDGSASSSLAKTQVDPCVARLDRPRELAVDFSKLHIQPAALLKDLDCVMGDEIRLKQLFSKVALLNEKSVASCIGFIAMRLESQEPQTEPEISSSQAIYEVLLSNLLFSPDTGEASEVDFRTLPAFNVEAFVRVVVDLKPDLDWNQIVRHLDTRETVIFSPIGFDVIAEAYTAATNKLMPAGLLLSTWRNRRTQFTLLTAAVASEGRRLDFSDVKPVLTIDWKQPKEQTGPLEMWCCLPVLETLINLQHELGPQDKMEVRSLFEVPFKHFPSYVAVGIASVRTSDPAFQKELLAQVIRDSLMSSPYHSAVLQRVWDLQPSFVFAALMMLYNKDDAVILAKIFDILQELKVLDRFLNEIPNFSLALDLAVLASKRYFLNLKKWITEKIAKHGRVFIDACISYLEEKTQSQNAETFPIEAATVIFDCLHSCIENGSMPAELVNDLKRLYKSFTEKDARTNGTAGRMEGMRTGPLGGGIGGGGEGPAEQRNGPIFDPKIDDEANSYFSQVYAGQISIEEAVRLLLRFKVSQNPREVDIFNCMIHNLLDEYRFFPQYPERELQITGKLFGALVKHQVFSSRQTLRLALFCVCDALQRTPPGKLTMFGLRALEQFKNRLPEWRQYSAQLLQIPHLRQSAPELVAYIEDFLRNGNVTPGASDVSSPTAPAAEPRAETPVQAAAPPRPVLPAVSEPEEAIKDRVHFIFNNLTAQNVDQKAAELHDAVPTKHMDYLAKYIVERRAAIEPNFHELYVALLDRYNKTDSKLLPAVLARSYENVRSLLASEKIRTNSTESSSERGALKNLGTFIGSLTLGRNKPILAKDIDLKELIFEAYSEGRLIAAIPFCCKVLDACAKSRVFRPPNPWVTAILGLLRELLNLPDLKMNLKFEIEVLCKNINVDLKEIKPTDVLKTRKQPHKIDNPDFALKKTQAPTPQPAASPVATPEVASPNMDLPSAETAAPVLPNFSRNTGSGILGPPSLLPPSNVTLGGGNGSGADVTASLGGSTVIPNLAQHVTVNPSLTLFQTYPHLRKLLPIAIDRAVREIIQPVVQRSCTIACITTRELILKDFANETDIGRIRQAAHQMVEYLAGALALVTCKEPLRLAISGHLRSLLSSSGVDQNILEQTVNIVTAENLEVCCLIIERAGLQKATKDIDENLALAFQQKRQSQQQKPQATYSPYNDLLAPQMTVYDDFLRLSRLSNIETPGGASSPTVPQQPQQPPQPQQPQPQPQPQSQQQHPGVAQRQPSPSPPRSPGTLAKAGGKGVGLSMPQPAVNKAAPAQTMLQSHAQMGGDTPLTTQQVLERFNNIYPTLVSAIQIATSGNPHVSIAELPSDHEVQRLWTQIASWVRRSTPADEAGMAVAQKVFQRLFESDSTLHREVHVAILEALRDTCRRLPKELVSWLAYSDENRKFHRECIVALLKPGNILNVTEYDGHLAKAIDGGKNTVALDFAAFLVRRCILEGSLATPAELFGTLEVMHKVGSRPNPPMVPSAPEGLLALVDAARRQGQVPAKINQQHVADESEGWEQLGVVLEDWRSICTTSKGISAEHVNKKAFVQQTLGELIATQEGKEKFFTLGIENVFTKAYQLLALRDDAEGAEKAVGASSPFALLDAFSLLFVAVVAIDADSLSTLELGLSALCKSVRVTATHPKQQDGDQVDLRPHFRLFYNLMAELCGSTASVSAASESLRAGEENVVVLSAFRLALEAVKPQKVPAFAFCWLELISCKHFMPHVLSSQQSSWSLFESLLVELLGFLNPYLQASSLSNSIKALYEGTLRTLLVLLHDFPEFLCDYHFSLCNVIPPNCIQLRNLILSAFPRSMRLPDPFTMGLKVDKLPEMATKPNVLSDFTSALSRNSLKATLDNHLKTRAPASMLLDLRSRLQLSAAEAAVAGTKYNIPAINALVFYVGQNATSKMFEVDQPINRTPHMDLFHHLISDLDAEGRYHFLNAIANHLRYPNYHTHYYSCVLLYLFSEAKQEIVQEQITRVLVERCLANRPHPWGLLLTFVELIKNPRYSFWSHSFVHCAPEIERLFESVAKSCMGTLSLSSREEMGISGFA